MELFATLVRLTPMGVAKVLLLGTVLLGLGVWREQAPRAAASIMADPTRGGASAENSTCIDQISLKANARLVAENQRLRKRVAEVETSWALALKQGAERSSGVVELPESEEMGRLHFPASSKHVEGPNDDQAEFSDDEGRVSDDETVEKDPLDEAVEQMKEPDTTNLVTVYSEGGNEIEISCEKRVSPRHPRRPVEL